MSASRLVNRNITSGAGRTSMRLEPEVWDALREICLREGIELRELIRRVEQDVSPGGRTSAIRVHVVQYFREAATEEGHLLARHGTSAASLCTTEMAEPGLSAGLSEPAISHAAINNATISNTAITNATITSAAIERDTLTHI